jgi:hypothetical protein
MAKLEELLKKAGYTDADLEGMKTLLADPKFRGALEGSVGELETQLTAARKEVEGWSTWHQEKAIPTLETALENERKAQERAAGAEARLRTLEEQGVLPRSQPPANEPPKPEAKFDPKEHNLVTMDQVAQFADAEGDAIALAQDLAAEHYELFGKPLVGLRDLRKEALAAKQPVDQYVRSKLKFSERRAEIAAKSKADEEAKIRADERAKVIAEQFNPMTRTPAASSNSLFARPAVEGNGKSTQPWDSPMDRSSERVSRAVQKLAGVTQ